MAKPKRIAGVPVVTSGRKLDLSPEERSRRSAAMKRLHEEGKAGGRLAGRPRRGESAAEARQRRLAEIAAEDEDPSPLPATPLYSAAEIAQQEAAVRAQRAAEASKPNADYELIRQSVRAVLDADGFEEPPPAWLDDDAQARAERAERAWRYAGHTVAEGGTRPRATSPWKTKGAGPANYP
jgi:hypothetical protein